MTSAFDLDFIHVEIIKHIGKKKKENKQNRCEDGRTYELRKIALKSS